MNDANGLGRLIERHFVAERLELKDVPANRAVTMLPVEIVTAKFLVGDAVPRARVAASPPSIRHPRR